jgi:hypothetical protein
MTTCVPAFTIAALCFTVTTSASVSIDNTVDSLSVPGIIQNNWAVNTDIDFTAAAVFVELSTGTLHNPNPIIAGLETFDQGSGDTFLGANGNPSLGIQGGAGDLGHFNATIGATDFGPTTLGATWNSPGADMDDIGAGLPLGRFSFTDDAQGTWSMAVTVANSPIVMYLSNPLIDGEMIFSPLGGDLNFDGFVGVDDLNTVLVAWNQSVTPGDRGAGDPSGDGFVGVDDLGIILVNWNNGMAPRPTVPVFMDLPGDANGDGFVGIDDKVNINWNQFVTPGDLGARDTSGDGFVGMDDLNILLSNWNAGTPPTNGATIPEPTSLGLLAVSCALFLKRRA